MKILSNLDGLLDDFVFQEIKNDPITAEQLSEMKALSGSYVSLFSKRARLYRELNLKNITLTEADYKSYLLKHYTFLKRPVFVCDNKIFIGNSKKNIEILTQTLQNDR